MKNHSLNNSDFYELFGVSSLLFREVKLEKALEILGASGFKWLDLSIVPNFCPHYCLITSDKNDDDNITSLIKNYGFQISSLNINPGYYNKNESIQIDKIIIRAAQLANKLNTRIITIPSGTKVELGKWENSVEKVSNHLNKIGKIIFEEYGVNLSIETPHQNTLTETLDESVYFHDAINSQFVKCTLDTSHIAAQDINDISKSFDKIGLDRINHIHLRDARKQNIAFTPGKGNIDYLSFFQKLKKSNYKGKLIFELEYHDFSVNKKIQELKFASEYTRNIYSKNKITLNNKIRTNNLYLFIEDFLYNLNFDLLNLDLNI